MADGHANASVRLERGNSRPHAENINASPPNPGAGESCALAATEQRGSGKPLYESPTPISAEALLRHIAEHCAFPIGFSGDDKHVFVLMDLPGEVYDQLASFQDDDPAGGNVEDEGEGDEDPGGGNAEDEGEPSCGWTNDRNQERLSAGTSLYDECEPSLGSLSALWDQERWAEQGNLANGWTAGHDTEEEHDGREDDDPREDDGEDEGVEDTPHDAENYDLGGCDWQGRAEYVKKLRQRIRARREREHAL